MRWSRSRRGSGRAPPRAMVRTVVDEDGAYAVAAVSTELLPPFASLTSTR